MDDDFALVRVVNRRKALELTNLSLRTWERLEAAGVAPPKTRISEGRVGYRVSDLKAWLDARREPSAA
jgi:predicted DNA-binding transcriptional regulator AlpA